MRTVAALPAPWIVSWLFLLACGIAAPLLGKRLPRRGDWLVALGGLTLLIATGGMGAEIADPAYGPFLLLREWIAPRSEAGAVTIGVVFDSLSTGMSLWVLVMLCVALASLGFTWQEPRSERLSGGAGIAAAGAVLSWHASTPWFALVGVGLTVLGAWTVAGSRWDQVREADLVARLVSERTWGLLLAGLGASIIAGSNPTLAVLAGEPMSDGLIVGAWVLAAGLLVFLSPFPLQGALSSPSELSIPFRILVQHLLPAAAAFAAFVRWADPLRAAGVLEPLGWLAMFSAATSFLFSLFASQWKSALLGWLSAAFAVAVALVAFEGPRAGVIMIVASGSAAFAMSLVGGFLDNGAATEIRGSGSTPTLRTLAMVAAFFGSGGVTSLSTGAWVSWFSRSLEDPAHGALVALLAVSLGLCFWRIGWKIKNAPGAGRPASGAQLSLAVVAVTLLLGVWWEGSLTGGLVAGDADRALPSWVASAAPNLRAAPAGEGADATALAVFLFAWITGLGIAYGTVRREDLWSGWAARWSGGTRFILGGYGFDRLGDFLMRGFDGSGRRLAQYSERVWTHWLPAFFSAVIEGASRQVYRAENWVLTRAGKGLRQTVVLSTQLVRINQTGDARWYVFFSIGVGILLLLTLMR